MYTGIITTKLPESKAFYTQYLGFEVIFEDHWFLLLKRGPYELAFMQPGLEDQHSLFRQVFSQGVWLALEVNDVYAEYKKLQESSAPILTEVKDEKWGDRYFVMQDPNGVGLDVYQRLPVEEAQ